LAAAAIVATVSRRRYDKLPEDLAFFRKLPPDVRHQILLQNDRALSAIQKGREYFGSRRKIGHQELLAILAVVLFGEPTNSLRRIRGPRVKLPTRDKEIISRLKAMRKNGIAIVQAPNPRKVRKRASP
jgi:hypothetical protein